MATVPFQTTPSEQLNVGAAPQLSATEVRPMDDTVTDDIERSSKAFNQFAQIAKGLQDEKDDAKSKSLSNEYQTRALEIENSYLTLELGAAVEQVGTGDDGEPIFAYDQKVNELNALKEEIAEKAENKNQLAIYNEKASASILTSTNRMSKHSLAEQTKFANAETLADIENTVTETGLSVDDFNMGDNSEYVKNLLALDVKIKNYAESKKIAFIGDSKNSTEDSETYINIRNGYLNKVHDASIGKLLINNEYRKAAEYLEFHKGNGTIAEGEVNKHMKTITTGLNKENGENIAKNIIDGKNINSNDGGFNSSAQIVMSLEGSNNANNSNGLPHVEGNGKEINIQNLEELQKESKYYKEGATVSLPPEHRTTHLFLTKELGVQKADSLFTKANTLLKEEGFVIDKEKMKNDSAYAAEVNAKLMEKVVGLSKEELGKKYGEGNELDLYSKDLDTVVSKIDYTYKDTQQPSMRVGEDGVFNLEDALVFARENIKDKNVLEYVEANLKDLHTERTEFAEENYKDKILKPAEDLAYAKPGGWKDIKPEIWEQLKNDDKENLRKGFAKSDDIDTLIAYEEGTLLKPGETIDDYRYLMTEKTYYAYKTKEKGAGSGSGSGSGSASVDKEVLDIKLEEYGYTKILNKKGDGKFDYLQILKAWKDQVEDAKKNGVTLDRQKKELILESILANKVRVGGFATRTGKEYVVAAVDKDQLSKTFSIVKEQNGQFKKIYHNQIPDEVRSYMLDGYSKNGLRLSYQEMTERWVQLGKPKSVIDLEMEVRYQKGEISKITKTKSRFNFF